MFYLVLGGIAAVVAGAFVWGESSRSDYGQQCRDAGGLPYLARDAWICLRPDAVINLNQTTSAPSNR